jgi:hypothetical protein
MLNQGTFALAGGILWAACLFITTLIAAGTGYAMEFLRLVGSIYPGYDVSVTGSVVGLIYGFLDAYIGCYLFAWLYNRLSK